MNVCKGLITVIQRVSSQQSPRTWLNSACKVSMLIRHVAWRRIPASASET